MIGGAGDADPVDALLEMATRDVSAALAFANAHDLAVSVKTTGHSYTGSSTAKGSPPLPAAPDAAARSSAHSAWGCTTVAASSSRTH